MFVSWYQAEMSKNFSGTTECQDENAGRVLLDQHLYIYSTIDTMKNCLCRGLNNMN